MIHTQYIHPVNQLLTYPSPKKANRRPSYRGLDISEAHIPDLIRMGTDIDLLWAEPGTPASTAPVHAWRLLGRFQAMDAIEPLVQLLKMPDINPYIEDELPGILSLFGAPAIPALHGFLKDPKNGEEPRICAIETLTLLAKAYVGARIACIGILIDRIKRADKSERIINGFIVSSLIDLKAKVSINAIKAAYQNEAVDPAIAGEWPSVAFAMREAGNTTGSSQRANQNNRSKGPIVIYKTGRNEPCPCGSGKKYKKCCRALTTRIRA